MTKRLRRPKKAKFAHTVEVSVLSATDRKKLDEALKETRNLSGLFSKMVDAVDGLKLQLETSESRVLDIQRTMELFREYATKKVETPPQSRPRSSRASRR